MAKRISPARVGAFVLGALLLIGGAVAILGGADLFNTKDRRIIYFQDSVKGLYIGSAVTFRGVEIGRVASIGLIYDPATNTSVVPVVVDLEPNRVSGLGGNQAERDQQLRNMIKLGLRAQLAPDSLLANTEIIQLEFFPASKLMLLPNNTSYQQIPATPSTLQQLQAELSNAMQHLPALADTVNATVKNLNALLSPANQKSLTIILANTATISTSIANHQNEVGDAMENLDHTTRQIAQISDNLNQMLAENRAPLKATMANLSQTVVATRKLADQLDGILAEDRAGLKQFSNGTLYQLSGLIADTRRAVHRTNDTLDQLDRDPASFLFGKKSSGIPAK